jgi:hypothetical protein
MMSKRTHSIDTILLFYNTRRSLNFSSLLAISCVTAGLVLVPTFALLLVTLGGNLSFYIA